jgi:hypothetical protein
MLPQRIYHNCGKYVPRVQHKNPPRLHRAPSDRPGLRRRRTVAARRAREKACRATLEGLDRPRQIAPEVPSDRSWPASSRCPGVRSVEATEHIWVGSLVRGGVFLLLTRGGVRPGAVKHHATPPHRTCRWWRRGAAPGRRHTGAPCRACRGRSCEWFAKCRCR